MDHITVIASVFAFAVSFSAFADKPARCADACKDAARPTVAATALLSDGSTWTSSRSGTSQKPILM